VIDADAAPRHVRVQGAEQPFDVGHRSTHCLPIKSPHPSIHPSIHPNTHTQTNSSRGDSSQQSYQQAPGPAAPAGAEGGEERQGLVYPMATDATQTDEGAYLTWEERFGGLFSTRQSRTILVRPWW
jgi:hypothetical protein